MANKIGTLLINRKGWHLCKHVPFLCYVQFTEYHSTYSNHQHGAKWYLRRQKEPKMMFFSKEPVFVIKLS